MRDISLKAGTLIVFSTGEYSDYGYQGHFLALQDVDADKMRELGAQAEAMDKDESGDRKYEIEPNEAFIGMLIRQGFIMIVDVKEIHIGSYGRVEL
jgi:hypothetical protein